MTSICFFNTTRFWGGGEKWHYETAVYLAGRGHQVFFIAHPGSELQKRLAQTQVTLFPMAVFNPSFLNPVKIYKLAFFLRSRKIRTIVFNGSSEAKLGAVAARLAGVKAVVYRRGLAVPVKNIWLNRFIYGKLITHFLTNSRETANSLFRHLTLPRIAERNCTIYNGIDFSHFCTPASENHRKKHSSKVILGCAGRLVEQKGHKYIIAMAAQLKKQNLDFKLLIAGEGPLRQSLEYQIQERGLVDEVRLLGFVSDMRWFVHQLDIFVFPSLWEGFGFAIAEAMAAALPVVAFDISSNPEVIEHGVTGFLVPPKQVDTFTKKTFLLAKNPDLRRQMGKKGKARVQQMFDRTRQLQKLETYLCQKVLNE